MERVSAPTPAKGGNGAEFLALVTSSQADEDFAADVAAADKGIALEGLAGPAD